MSDTEKRVEYLNDGRVWLVTPEDRALLERDKLMYGQIFLSVQGRGRARRMNPADLEIEPDYR